MQFAGTAAGEDGGGALNSTENPMQGKWLYLRRFLKVRANECVKLKLAPNASQTVICITGWSNWILLRKLKYSMLGNIERALSNSIQSTSISCAKFSWTTLYRCTTWQTFCFLSAPLFHVSCSGHLLRTAIYLQIASESS